MDREEPTVDYAPSKFWFQHTKSQVPAPEKQPPLHKHFASNEQKSVPLASLQSLKEVQDALPSTPAPKSDSKTDGADDD